MIFAPERAYRPPAGISRAQVALLALGLSAVGALATVLLSSALLLAFVAALLLGGVFIRAGANPFLPYLVLVAAIQAGTLLHLPQAGGLISGVLPLLGAWVLLAFLMEERRPDRLIEARSAGAPEAPGGPASLSRATLAAFGALALATTIGQTWSPDARPWTINELLTLVQLTILVVVSAVLVSSPRRLLAVAHVTILAGCLASLMAVGARFGLIYLPILSQEMVQQGITRVSGTVLDPNIFSFQLLVPLAFALNLAFASGSAGRLLLYAAACVVLGAGVASTYSAGAVLGAGTAVLASVLLRMRISLRAGLAALLVVSALTLGVALTLPQGYVDVVTAKYSQLSTQNVAGVGTGRGAAWMAAGRTIADRPLVGSGLTTEYVQTAVAENYREERVKYKAAHNTYLAVGVATGLPGLILFVIACLSALAFLWRRHAAAPPSPDHHWVGQYQTAIAGLITALVVVMTQALQLDLQMEKYLWLALGAALAVARWKPA